MDPARGVDARLKQQQGGDGVFWSKGNGQKRACGPVITCSDHNAYRGAAVGSNNTGEISAIIEALLHAHQRASKQVVIHSDSLWAINTITARWRAKSHKAMVNVIMLGFS